MAYTLKHKTRFAGILCGVIILTFIFSSPTSEKKEEIKEEAVKKGPLADRVIVLDPGHGGVDGGAVAEGLMEKEVVLDIGLEAARLLEDLGAEVVLTRTDDSDLSHLNQDFSWRQHRDLKARADLAWEAEGEILVSIHLNALEIESVRGAIMFYQERCADSRKLAELMQEEFYSLQPYNKHEATCADFFLLQHSRLPTVVAEAAFITNPRERELLRTGSYRRQVAETLVQGIKRFLLMEEDKQPAPDE